MNLIKCPNDHYYNSDKFPYCPQCSNAEVYISDSQKPSIHKLPTENIVPLTAVSNPYFERLTSGWLVCLTGINRGTSYPIYPGDNHIGRNPNMNIRIREEAAISREDHAVIHFNSTDSTFIITPGNSTNLTTVNNEPVTDKMILSDRDLIQLGECQLLFVSLCNESFHW